MLKRFAIALCLFAAPLSAMTACASFEVAAPKSVRVVIADAEVALIGAADMTVTLHEHGTLSTDAANDVFDKLVSFAKQLDDAKTAYAAGDALLAARTVQEFSDALSALVLQLSLARDEYVAVPPPPQPTPTPMAFRASEA